MVYSGRVTDHCHKFDDWQEHDASHAEDCIRQHTLFDVQWSNCPVEVEAEVKQLWRDFGLGNDYYYVHWNTLDYGEEYPIIDEYLKSRGVTECLIHWWW